MKADTKQTKENVEHKRYHDVGQDYNPRYISQVAAQSRLQMALWVSTPSHVGFLVMTVSSERACVNDTSNTRLGWRNHSVNRMFRLDGVQKTPRRMGYRVAFWQTADFLKNTKDYHNGYRHR